MNAQTIAVRMIGVGAICACLALAAAVGILELHWAARVAGCLAAVCSLVTGYFFVIAKVAD